MASMTMYVDLLSRALEGWVSELTDAELLSYARTCRDALEHRGAYGVTSNAEVLAAEISYDRALVRLCEVHDIVLDVRAFLFPHAARANIEAALQAAGVHLSTPSPSPSGPNP